MQSARKPLPSARKGMQSAYALVEPQTIHKNKEDQLFRKNKRRIILALVLLSLATLACNAPETQGGWALLCESTGGEWVYSQEFQSDANCDRSKNNQSNAGADIPNSENPADPSITLNDSAENDGVPADLQDHPFSVEDCSCNGVSMTLDLDASSASKNNLIVGISSGGQVERIGHLTCDWRDDYHSENKTGTIRILLDVAKFHNDQYAQTFYTDLKNEIASQPPYCEAEPDRCTVAIAEFGNERSFYVHKNIYVGGQGELPSDHGSNMARLIAVDGTYYVLDFFVTHPELELGDNWVVEVSRAVEACVESLAQR